MVTALVQYLHRWLSLAFIFQTVIWYKYSLILIRDYRSNTTDSKESCEWYANCYNITVCRLSMKTRRRKQLLSQLNGMVNLTVECNCVAIVAFANQRLLHSLLLYWKGQWPFRFAKPIRVRAYTYVYAHTRIHVRMRVREDNGKWMRKSCFETNIPKCA